MKQKIKNILIKDSDIPEGFWTDKEFWAPECIRKDNRYFLIATFGTEGKPKGIQILESASPAGPFSLLTEEPVTPKEWNCLDGTVFTDHAGKTWLIFSHGFPQEPEGAIIAAKLSSDMKRLVSEPATLFHSGNNRQKFELLICTAIVLIVTKISKEPERKTLPALSINSVQINLAEYHISHNSSGSILIALQVLK